MSDLTVTTPQRPDLGGNLHHGDDATHCPQLWSYLIDRFAVRSMLDVGCGEGHAVSWFYRNDVYAVGIDGLFENVARAVTPIVHHDLTESAFHMPVDLVWSCEVAEHIDVRYVEIYLNTLANGSVVAMTHAVPGQGGWHHVNEQPPDYWIVGMRQRGYELHAAATRIARAVTEGWPTYFNSTGLIFVRG